MESKDQVKKGFKDRTAKMSEKVRAKANLKEEGTGKKRKIGEENHFGSSGEVGQNSRVSGTRNFSDTNEHFNSEPEISRVQVKRHRNRDHDSEGSNGNFLSSVKSNKKAILGFAGALAGGALLFRAFKGEKPFAKKAGEVQLHTKQTVLRSREELYAYWRNLENLPNFMSHIEEIKEIDERRSRWTAKIPGGVGTIDWEAMIEQDLENEYISWRSVADSEIENSGEVRFKDVGGGKGTIVETTIFYRPPAGKAGEYVAKLLNPAFEKIVKKDLEQFKKHMEVGGEARGEN